MNDDQTQTPPVMPNSDGGAPMTPPASTGDGAMPAPSMPPAEGGDASEPASMPAPEEEHKEDQPTV